MASFLALCYINQTTIMNYFELYNLPISLQVDTAALKQTFYALSRQYHPDFFSGSSDEEQQEVLEKSSMVNKAFKTFSSTDDTIKYVLMLKGLLQEEEKYQLPNDFLMDMMELNEQLMEAKMEGDEQKLDKLTTNIKQLTSNLYEPVKEIVEHYQEGVTTQEELLQVKDYYYKKKYLNRILAGMQ
jgi:molecular chaperone HscB